MDITKVIFRGMILLMLFAGLGFFLSSKNISSFAIQKSGIAYSGSADIDNYFLDLKCTRNNSSTGKKGKISIDVLREKEKVNHFDKSVFFERLEKSTTLTNTVPIASFNLDKKENYQIKTEYEGDSEIISACKIIFSVSTPFLSIQKKNWFYILIVLAMITGVLTLLYYLREKIRYSSELKKQINDLGEPIKIIRKRKDRRKILRLLPGIIFLSIPFGFALAVIFIIIPSVLLKTGASITLNLFLSMFPFAFILMLFNVCLKAVECRFYKDKLYYFHSFFVIYNRKIILYDNISLININPKNKAIVINYKDEYGEIEQLEIESNNEQLSEDYKQILDLIKK